MSFEHSSKTFTKDKLDQYLKEVAKEYRKLTDKRMKAEIILIGGAAILANYSFREMTTDIDAAMYAASTMEDAICRVGDRYNLPKGWLNSDFMKTKSYSEKLSEVSVYYRTFSNVLEVRTVEAEYLIAMKLCAGRNYKNDLSDIVGILAEHQRKLNPITMSMINHAVNKLYDSWDQIPKESIEFIEKVIKREDYNELYTSIKAEENISRDILVTFDQVYPKAVNESNLRDILATLKNKKGYE